MSAAETSCPTCQRALPPSVVSGPAQAVVRCEGCSALLLWSNGKVVRTAKSSTPTAMGMPAVKPPGAVSPAPAAAPQFAAPKPTAKPAAPVPVPAAAKLPALTSAAAKTDDDEDDVTRIDGVDLQAEPPLSALKPETDEAKATAQAAAKAAAAQPAKPIARIQPTKTIMGMPAVTETGAVVSAPSREPSAKIDLKPAATPPAKKDVSGKIDVKPQAPPPRKDVSGKIEVKKDASAKIDVKPVGAMPSVEVKKEPSSKISAQVAPKQPENKPARVVAAVAPSVPLADAPGPLVDPSSWFHDQPITGKGATVPAATPPRGEPSGAQPLPPPPASAKSPPAKTDVSGPIPLPPPPGASAPPPVAIADPYSDKTPPLGYDLNAEAAAASKAALPPAAPTPSREPPRQPTAPSVVVQVEPSPPPKPAPKTTPRAAPNQPTLQALQAPRPVQPVFNEPVAARVTATIPAPSEIEPPTKPIQLPPAPSQLPDREVALLPRREKPNKKLFVYLGAGAAGVLLLAGVLTFALSHSGETPKRPVVATPAPEKVEPLPAPPTPTPTPTPAPTPPPVAVAPKPPAPETPEPAAPSAGEPGEPAHPRTRTLGGKKVVLDYDPKPNTPEPPPPSAPVPAGEDPGTVARAREAYHKGNNKLFSGDSDGAVGAYRESIKIYPGYVAGYRGLGLAYAEQGNTDEALNAFKKYIGTVPNAKDVTIIKKRIDHLEKSR